MAVGYSPEQRTKNGGLWTVRNLQCPGRNPQSWAWRSGSCSHPCAPSSSAPSIPCISHTPSQPSAKTQSHKHCQCHSTDIWQDYTQRERERGLLKLGYVLVASCESELPRWSCPCLLDVDGREGSGYIYTDILIYVLHNTAKNSTVHEGGPRVRRPLSLWRGPPRKVHHCTVFYLLPPSKCNSHDKPGYC